MLEATIETRLRDFTLNVENLIVNDGETLGLLGTNGAGKSTILKIISGLMKPDNGRIVLNDTILLDRKEKISVDAELRNIGYMFQNYALFPNMTVRKNIGYGLKMHHIPKADADKRIDELIEKLSLREIENQPVMHLSGGQCQRVALARALAPRPALLLLDEPLSALDARTQDMLRGELSRIIHQENIPCILVTHTAKDALAIADRICVLNQGKIIAEGNPEDIVYDPQYGFFTADNLNVFRGTMTTCKSGAICVKIANIVFRTISPLTGDVMVSIRPEDIIISKERFESSAVNVFDGEIIRIAQTTGEEVIITVDIGIPLAVAVTRQSVERLGLQQGGKIVATFKAASVVVQQ